MIRSVGGMHLAILTYLHLDGKAMKEKLTPLEINTALKRSQGDCSDIFSSFCQVFE